jgi:hypothetical protein
MNQNTKTYHQPGSDIPVLGEWDVVVVGSKVEPAFEILRDLPLAK